MATGSGRDAASISDGIDLRDPGLPAEAVIEALSLAPHPEGGFFRETWRDRPADGSRGVGTAIHFLLRDGETSAWHRVDADELWIWQAGARVGLRFSPEGRSGETRGLGPGLARGEVPHLLVPRANWQTATSVGGWTLACCVVVPAFSFEGFELEPGVRPLGATTNL